MDTYLYWIFCLLSLPALGFILPKHFRPINTEKFPISAWSSDTTLWWRSATPTRSLPFLPVGNWKAIRKLHMKYDIRLTDLFLNMSKCVVLQNYHFFKMSVEPSSHLCYEFYYFTITGCYHGNLPFPLHDLILSHPNFPRCCHWLGG